MRHDEKGARWLDKHGVVYSFHDYKTAGIDRAHLEKWIKKASWETVLNRAGTTFRKLPDEDKANLDAAKAIMLMLAHPTAIKRPVLEFDGDKVLVGFRPELYDGAGIAKN